MSSSQQSGQDTIADADDDTEPISYWHETPQEEDGDASVFFASMGAK